MSFRVAAGCRDEADQPLFDGNPSESKLNFSRHSCGAVLFPIRKKNFS
jgi:hypothetical protein